MDDQSHERSHGTSRGFHGIDTAVIWSRLPFIMAAAALLWQAGATWGGSESKNGESIRRIEASLVRMDLQFAEQRQALTDSFSSRATEIVDRLNAQADRISVQAVDLNNLEKLVSSNATAISNLIEREQGKSREYQLVIQASKEDRAQINQRLKEVEATALSIGIFSDRLNTIEDLIQVVLDNMIENGESVELPPSKRRPQ